MTERIARKRHKCARCGKAIEKGERYIEERVVIVDGGWYDFILDRLHLECGGKNEIVGRNEN